MNDQNKCRDPPGPPEYFCRDKTNSHDDMARGRSKTVENKEVFEACREIAPSPFGAAEIAAELPIGSERARQRLNELVDQGLLRNKKIGQTNVYWFGEYYSASVNSRNSATK